MRESGAAKNTVPASQKPAHGSLLLVTSAPSSPARARRAVGLSLSPQGKGERQHDGCVAMGTAHKRRNTHGCLGGWRISPRLAREKCQVGSVLFGGRLFLILPHAVKHPKDSGISGHYKSRGHHSCDWIIYSSAFTLPSPKHRTKRKVMKSPPLQPSLSNLKRHFQEPFSLDQGV